MSCRHHNVRYFATLTSFRKETAVTGIGNIEKNKSEMHKERIKAVVECCRNFGSRSNTIAVIKLPNRRKISDFQFMKRKTLKFSPANPTTVKMIKNIAPNIFAVEDIILWVCQSKNN